MALAKREAGDFVALRTPGAENAEDVRVTQDGDQIVAQVSLTEHGIYEIEPEVDPENGEVKPGVVVAANVNASESNVRVVEGPALANSLDDTGVKVLNRAGSMADAIQDERRGSEFQRAGTT